MWKSKQETQMDLRQVIQVRFEKQFKFDSVINESSTSYSLSRIQV